VSNPIDVPSTCAGIRTGSRLSELSISRRQNATL